MNRRYFAVVRVDEIEGFPRNIAYFNFYDDAILFCRKYIEEPMYRKSEVAPGFPVMKVFDCRDGKSFVRCSVYPNAYDGSRVECLEVV